MTPSVPPDFNTIAGADVKRAFVGHKPASVEWLAAGTKLYKWTKSITGRHGVSPWWFFVESRVLPIGVRIDGLKERQARAKNIGASDKDFHRVRAGVTKQWNPMTSPMAIRLVNGAWGYIGKAAGQPVDNDVANVEFISGDYQVWIPGLKAVDVAQISILPYLAPSAG